MATIIFNNIMLDEIVAGVRKQTSRVWKKQSKIKVGDIVTATNYRRKIPIVVTETFSRSLDGITDDDATHNGHPTAESLRNALIGLYGNVSGNVSIFRFEYIG